MSLAHIWTFLFQVVHPWRYQCHWILWTEGIGSVDGSVITSLLCTWLICKVAHVASIFIFDPLRQPVSSAYGKHYSFVSLQCHFLHRVGVYNKNNCVYVAKHTLTSCINWALSQPLKIQIKISLKNTQAIQRIVHTEESKWYILKREEFSYAGASYDWSWKYHPTSSTFRCLIIKMRRRGREGGKEGWMEISAERELISGLWLSKRAVTCQFKGRWLVPKCGVRAGDCLGGRASRNLWTHFWLSMLRTWSPTRLIFMFLDSIPMLESSFPSHQYIQDWWNWKYPAVAGWAGPWAQSAHLQGDSWVRKHGMLLLFTESSECKACLFCFLI